MKWLFLFVVLLCLVVPRAVRAQMDVKTDPRIAPLLRQAANGQRDLVVFGRRPVSNMYVNMAVLDKTGKRLYWFTCYGTAYDSVRLEAAEYAKIVSNAVDPFNLYKELCLENEAYLDDATEEYRRLGKLALKDTSYTRRMIYNSASIKSAHSTLQQLMVIEGFLKIQRLKLCLFNCPSTSSLSGNDRFLIRKSLAGKVVDKSDSTIFYATSPLELIAKISLCRQDSLKAFVYDGQGHVVDSMPLRPGKYSSLLKSRDDVFLLYRGWLELQSQQLKEVIHQLAALLNRRDTGLYLQTYRLVNTKQLLLTMAQFKNQQQDIERKIFSLTLPDEEMIGQMLQSSNPSGRGEITYLSGGMGFAYTVGYKRGEKVYELTNHLGNVMSTVDDKKVSVANGNGTVAYYNADIVNSNDYYPFGHLMPGRSYSSDNRYRYGFNGKENDDDVKGVGNLQDYGMRIYDPRIGRFLSLDPLEKSYPELTPYQFGSNRPIDGIDLDGEEWTKISTYDATSGMTYIHFEVKLKIVNESTIFTDIQTLKAEISRQFKEAFRGVEDKNSKISYSASISVDQVTKFKEGDFGVIIGDSQKPENGFVETGGMGSKTDTKVNIFTVNGDNYLTGERLVNPAKSVGHDVIHELMHTAGLYHPQDDENTAEDVDLVPNYTSDGKFSGFTLGSGASLDLIVNNILSYGSLKIDGKRVNEYQPDKTKRNKVSPDQATITAKQIDKDEEKTKSH